MNFWSSEKHAQIRDFLTFPYFSLLKLQQAFAEAQNDQFFGRAKIQKSKSQKKMILGYKEVYYAYPNPILWILDQIYY